MRSKEEILKQHCKFIHFEKTNITFENVSQAMDTYAAQSVAEFKERLKEAIRRDLPVSLVNKDTFLTLIDETK